MSQRKFYRYDEAADLVGDRETVRQAMLAGELPAFIELHDCHCSVYADGGKYPPDGANKFARWCDDTFPFDTDPKRKHRTYTLDGWFRLDRIAIESFGRATGTHGVWPVLGDMDDGATITFEIGVDSRNTELWFRADDIESLAAPAPAPTTSETRSEKPLDTRERATLLCIIGALAANADLDLAQPMKAGDAIAAMLPGDVKLSGRTIGEHLKAVRVAIDSRKG